MKKRYSKIFPVLLIPVILFVFLALFFQIQCRIIHSGIKEPCKTIYIPNGVADSYKDLLGLSIDEHKIWEFSLNSAEKRKMEESLNNPVWCKVTASNTEEIKYFFTINEKSYFRNEITDDSYYCIYNFALKKFVPTDKFVGHRALFVYDKANARYYCVSQSI